MSKTEVLSPLVGTPIEDQRPQHAPGIRARRTTEGWRIDLDTASWAEVMTALSIVIDYSDRDREATFRALRSA